jgi:bifunctional ADP-heptose synthase (sugar kinase/adenylyltransferase)
MPADLRHAIEHLEGVIDCDRVDGYDVETPERVASYEAAVAILRDPRADARKAAVALRAEAREIASIIARARAIGILGTDTALEILERAGRRLSVRAAELDPDEHDPGTGKSESATKNWAARKRGGR